MSDDNDLIAERRAKLAAIRAAGVAFPNDFKPKDRAAELVRKHGHLDNEALEDVGHVDLVLDLIGGDVGKRSARLVRAGGTLVSIVGPSEERPAAGSAIDFVVESDRAQLGEIVHRVRDGRLRTNIGTVSRLDDAVAAFNPAERRPGKTIICVGP